MAAVLYVIATAEQPPSSGTEGVWPADLVVTAALLDEAEVAEVAEAADLGVSHANATEAQHVPARSVIASSRSDFMDPTSRKVRTLGTSPQTGWSLSDT